MCFYEGPMMNSFMGGGMMMMILMMLFFGVIIWGMFSFFTKWTERKDITSNALVIAQERFARGEISQEEYENIKKHL